VTTSTPAADPERLAGPIAILVVHGIGAQEPGETSRKLLAGLARADPTLDRQRCEGAFDIGGRQVRLYEVYWADELKGELANGAFQMSELQSLSWFPWFNYRCRAYAHGSYTPLKLAWWWVVLPIFTFFAAIAYHGAGLLMQIVRGGHEPRAVKEGTFVERASQAAESALPHEIDRLLDEYLGDVFTYINSAGNAFHREEGEPRVRPEVQEVYLRIVQRLYRQLLAAHADGCAEVHVVAHSLGTVIAFHAFSGFRFEAAGGADANALRSALRKVRRLYTIGSPLEKIRFFWPRLIPPGPGLCGPIRWDNFVSWFDPVAGALTRFGGWGEVVNHRLLGGGFLRGHVVYEHSPVFLQALIRGVCGRELPLRRTPRERRVDRMLLAGETVFAPAALVIVLACGIALFVFAALLLPFLLSLVLRQFLAERTWVRIENVSALVFAGGFVISYLIAPLIRAARVHRLYWTASGSADTEPMA
jgi:hypothetical protein